MSPNGSDGSWGVEEKVMGLVPVTSKSATTWSALLRNKKEPCRRGAKLIYPHLS